ncbi:MAG: DNA-processing protein DprA [Campylobacterota bacterium]|nr:DNA-processing protein DprA [Campylobacterota bacterium]
MNVVTQRIDALDAMKSYPPELYFEGNLELLKKVKVSIVGSRKTSKYSRELTHKLANTLAKAGVCVVSGGAMGVDAVAHLGAGAENTISVLPCGVNIKYPAVNKNLLTDIQNRGLLLSQFQENERARPWSFVVRNELVVALGEVLVVAEAELDSGSMRSIEFALKMGKEIFVFPHRLGESSATNELLKEGKAKAIYDVDSFVSRFGTIEKSELKEDEFTLFCKDNPTYEETLSKFASRVFEAELNAEIEVRNGKVFLL